MIKPVEVKLGFGNPEVQGYSVILDYYSGTQISSDRTSSVPLAQYWKAYPRRLLEIEHQTGLSLLHPQIHFEYATESLGNANASMSDVMILADGVRIAIEAKFTEFAKNGFQTIGGWLSTGNKENRRRVLDHWVNMIIPYSESDLTNIEDIPYQFLHRLACACDKHPEHAILLYQLFVDDKTRSTFNEMLSVLTATKERINPKSNLKIVFQQIECRQVRHYAGDKLKNIFSDMKSDRGHSYYFPDD